MESFVVARDHHRRPRVAHADRLAGQANTGNAERETIDGPMLFQSIGVGKKKGEPALPNATPVALNNGGAIDPFWDKRLSPGPQYRLVRTAKTAPLGPLKFTPIG